MLFGLSYFHICILNFVLIHKLSKDFMVNSLVIAKKILLLHHKQ